VVNLVADNSMIKWGVSKLHINVVISMISCPHDSSWWFPHR